VSKPIIPRVKIFITGLISNMNSCSSSLVPLLN